MWAIAFLLHGVTAASCSAFTYSRGVTPSGLQQHGARPRRCGHARDCGSGLDQRELARLEVERQAYPGAIGRRPADPWGLHGWPTVPFRAPERPSRRDLGVGALFWRRPEWRGRAAMLWAGSSVGH